MHFYETISINTFMEFLYKIEEFKIKGYHLTDTNADKHIVFDGKNTVECLASVSVTLTKGTATYTLICTI